jgi:hypothetical protein
MAYPYNPEVASSYSFQIYADNYDNNMFTIQATGAWGHKGP